MTMEMRQLQVRVKAWCEIDILASIRLSAERKYLGSSRGLCYECRFTWHPSPSHQVMERADVLAEIRRDYEENKYFVSGQGDMASYAPDCEFSDPFVSFRGVDRFRANVSNLGAYL